MSNTNMILVCGNVGQEPEMRFTPDQTAVLSFSVAHTERRLNRTTNQWEDGRTEWFKVKAWGRKAEALNGVIGKGNRVVVRGSARAEAWVDKSTGQARGSVVITAEDVWLQPRTNNAGGYNAPQTTFNQPLDEPPF